MEVWVVTFNYSILVGVYDSQEKAHAAAKQYLADMKYTDICTHHGKNMIGEWWRDESSEYVIFIEHTRVV